MNLQPLYATIATLIALGTAGVAFFRWYRRRVERYSQHRRVLQLTAKAVINIADNHLTHIHRVLYAIAGALHVDVPESPSAEAISETLKSELEELDKYAQR